MNPDFEWTGDVHLLNTGVVRQKVEQTVGGGRSGILEDDFGKVPKHGHLWSKGEG